MNNWAKEFKRRLAQWDNQLLNPLDLLTMPSVPSCRLSLQTHYNLSRCHWRNPWDLRFKVLHNLPPPQVLLQPFVLPALIAWATAAISGAFKKVPKFAKGGIVSTPTLGMFGEYAGARQNPEVVAPLDRLTSMIEPRGAQQVDVGGSFQLRGQDLVVALQRAETNRGRIK